MIKLGQLIFRSKKKSKKVSFRNFRTILTFFDPKFKIFLEVFLVCLRNNSFEFIIRYNVMKTDASKNGFMTKLEEFL